MSDQREFQKAIEHLESFHDDDPIVLQRAQVWATLAVADAIEGLIDVLDRWLAK